MTWALVVGPRYLVNNIGLLSSAIAAVVAWRGSGRSDAARRFAWWLVLGAVFNLVGSYFGRQGITNLDIYHWYRLFSVLLIGITAHRLLTEPMLRRLVIGLGSIFVAFWVSLPISGAESTTSISRFLAPAESAFILTVGVLLVAESIRNRDGRPVDQAEYWIGVGFVVAAATTLVSWPIMAELYARSPSQAVLVSKGRSLIGDVALLIWCIPYWKRSVVWTR